MANNYDFKAPVDLNITNRTVANSIVMEDAGSYTGPDAVLVGEEAYAHSDIQIPMYKTNICKVLAAGDSLTVSAATSGEVAHFMSLANENISVEVVVSQGDGGTSE